MLPSDKAAPPSAFGVNGAHAGPTNPGWPGSDQGTAFILVEQHAELALSLTDDAIVLERGAIVHRARSQDLLRDRASLDRLIGLQISGQ